MADLDGSGSKNFEELAAIPIFATSGSLPRTVIHCTQGCDMMLKERCDIEPLSADEYWATEVARRKCCDRVVRSWASLVQPPATHVYGKALESVNRSLCRLQRLRLLTRLCGARTELANVAINSTTHESDSHDDAPGGGPGASTKPHAHVMNGQISTVNGIDCVADDHIMISIDHDGRAEALQTSASDNGLMCLEGHHRDGLIQDIMSAAMLGPDFLEQKLLSLYKSGDLDDGWCFPLLSRHLCFLFLVACYNQDVIVCIVRSR